jgi:hypothetical protein
MTHYINFYYTNLFQKIYSRTKNEMNISIKLYNIGETYFNKVIMSYDKR